MPVYRAPPETTTQPLRICGSPCPTGRRRSYDHQDGDDSRAWLWGKMSRILEEPFKARAAIVRCKSLT